MKRPIKFRGYDTDFPMVGMVTFTLDDLLVESESYGLVHPDSIAQLVGYDKNGKEVYEGDTVINPRDGTHFKAAMNHIYTVKIYIKETEQ